MAEIIVAESDATARPSIGTFQTFVAGKIGHDGAPGTVGAVTGAAVTRIGRRRSVGAVVAGAAG